MAMAQVPVPPIVPAAGAAAAVPIFLPIMVPLYQNAVRTDGNQNENVAIGMGRRFLRMDARTMEPKRWMNDEAINAYLDLIGQRSESQGANNNLPRVYAFNTFFYAKLCNGGYSRSLQRWTKGINIFVFDVVMFPINVGGNHWTLATADMRTMELKYHDSLGRRNETCLIRLLDYLEQEYEAKQSNEQPFLRAQWTFEHVAVPKQRNVFDCGAFVCKFAEYISQEAPLTFDPAQMDDYRRRMVYEVVTGVLIHP